MSVSGLDGLSVASLAAHSLREQTVIKCPGQDAGKRRLWHSELLALHKAWFPALAHGLWNVHSSARRGRTTLPSLTPLESSETGPDGDVSVSGSPRMTALAAGKLLSGPVPLVSTAIRPAVTVAGAMLPH